MVKIHCTDAKKFKEWAKILIKIKNKKETQSKLNATKIIFRIPFWIFLLEIDNYQNINRCLETSQDTSAYLPFLGRVPQICPGSLNILLHAFCDPALSQLIGFSQTSSDFSSAALPQGYSIASQCAGFILRLYNQSTLQLLLQLLSANLEDSST